MPQKDSWLFIALMEAGFLSCFVRHGVKTPNTDDCDLSIWCHWTCSWEIMGTTGSKKLLWAECLFWDAIGPWLLHHKVPYFIFYYSDTRFSPSFYCFYFLFVIPNCRLNWGLNFPSLHFLPWHFPPFMISSSLTLGCSLEVVSLF